jgi:hypothetical protein
MQPGDGRSLLAPESRQEAFLTPNRIAQRERKRAHPCYHFGIRRLPADVPLLPGRIRAYHKEAAAVFGSAMTLTRG